MIYIALILISIALTVGVTFKAKNPEQDYVSSITDGMKQFFSDLVFVIKTAKKSGESDSESEEVELDSSPVDDSESNK